jgi:hypothetical protein
MIKDVSSRSEKLNSELHYLDYRERSGHTLLTNDVWTDYYLVFLAPVSSSAATNNG